MLDAYARVANAPDVTADGGGGGDGDAYGAFATTAFPGFAAQQPSPGVGSPDGDVQVTADPAADAPAPANRGEPVHDRYAGIGEPATPDGDPHFWFRVLPNGVTSPNGPPVTSAPLPPLEGSIVSPFGTPAGPSDDDPSSATPVSSAPPGQPGAAAQPYRPIWVKVTGEPAVPVGVDDWGNPIDAAGNHLHVANPLPPQPPTQVEKNYARWRYPGPRDTLRARTLWDDVSSTVDNGVRAFGDTFSGGWANKGNAALLASQHPEWGGTWADRYAVALKDQDEMSRDARLASPRAAKVATVLGTVGQVLTLPERAPALGAMAWGGIDASGQSRGDLNQILKDGARGAIVNGVLTRGMQGLGGLAPRDLPLESPAELPPTTPGPAAPSAEPVPPEPAPTATAPPASAPTARPGAGGRTRIIRQRVPGAAPAGQIVQRQAADLQPRAAGQAGAGDGQVTDSMPQRTVGGAGPGPTAQAAPTGPTKQTAPEVAAQTSGVPGAGGSGAGSAEGASPPAWPSNGPPPDEPLQAEPSEAKPPEPPDGDEEPPKVHPQALQTLGPDGVAALQRQIKAGAPASVIFSTLQPAYAAAPKGDPSMRPEDWGDEDFWTSRSYDGGRDTQAAVDHLTDGARAFAGDQGPLNERTAILVLGPPAAGKSTVAEYLAKSTRSALVDSDEAKKIIPGYDDGLGSDRVHMESAALANQVNARLVAQGANIVRPTVGADSAVIQSYIDDFRAQGYKVVVVNVSVPFDASVRRMAGRFLATGRLLDEPYLRSIGDGPGQTYAALRAAKAADGYAQVDTSGARGQERVTDVENPPAGLVMGRGLDGAAPPTGRSR